jgi:type IV secretion system protein TrbL
VGPLTKGATTIFWSLALISLCWTCAIMLLKRADLSEILVEITRYVMTIGIFFWLLTNGSSFAIAIINSLRMLGGQASGTGQAVFPGDLITLGVQVIQSQMKPMQWLFPVTAMIPVLLAVIILIVCILICANIVLLLISAWIVAYAGVVVLGFGSSRWTSDIAINYFRTALGVGLSLMTMQLVIAIGISFLQQLVQQTGNNWDIGGLLALTVAVIILGVVAHKLPQMVSGMVTGSGHHGGIGAMGLMSALGAGMAASRLAGVAAATVAGPAGLAGVAGMSAADKIAARISSAESVSGNGSSRMNSTMPSSSTPAARQSATASVPSPKQVTTCQ